MAITVQPIKMERYKARELYDQYKAHCKSKHTAEDRGIMLGYRALAEGKSVINIFDVFRTCPADHRGLPKLAIGRAHWERCWYDRERETDQAEFRDRERNWSIRKNARMAVVRIPAAHMSRETCQYYWHPGEREQRQRRNGPGRAIVPIIPANIRPKTSLERYHILWEADWDVVPRDPLLLRQIHGGVFAVLAQWDLTDLERAVLSGRL
jgi:hypothetical protein